MGRGSFLMQTRRGGPGRTNEIAVLEIEPVQLVASLLRIDHILVDHKCSPFGVAGYPLADLTMLEILVSPCFLKYTILRATSIGSLHLWYTHRTGPNLPNKSNSSSGVTL